MIGCTVQSLTTVFTRLEPGTAVQECVDCSQLVCSSCLDRYCINVPENQELCPACRYRAPAGESFCQEPSGLLRQMLDCLGRVAALDQREEEVE